MRLPSLSGLIFIVLLWALFYTTQNSYGADEPKTDMRVLIDISGSMKKSDPQNLRIPAVKLLLNLAKDGSQLGIWSFGQMVNNLVPLNSVSAEWKAKAIPKVDQINSAGLYTNIGLALEKASLGQTRPEPGWDRSMVLLSDGKVDISKDPKRNEAEKQRILTELIPRLQKAGFKIQTVALSDKADQDFLKQLSNQTGGTFSMASDADALLEVFVAASDRVNMPDQVPLEGNRFAIDNSVKEFTILIFRKSDMKETKLIAPDGSQFSLSKGSHNVSWFAEKAYDLVTVYNPAPGKWEVIADIDPDNRVTVVSDLKVDMKGLPETVLEGEQLVMSMSLIENDRIITNPNFLKLMDITFRQDSATGETFEGKLSEAADGEPKVPEDGLYTAKLGRTITEGTHHFSILLDGKTFKRKKTQAVTVHRQILDVTPAYRDNQGELLRYLDLQTIKGLVNPEDIQIVAQITDPEGEKSLQNAAELGGGQYSLDVPALGSKGVYEVLIKASGTSLNGYHFELVQGPYSVDYTPLEISNADSTETTASGEQVDPGAEMVETFDDAALEIPSLEVEELPPEGVAVESSLPPEMAPTNTDLSQSPEAEEADASGFDLTLLLIIAGNLIVVAGGIFVYMKFLRKTDEEQTKVVQEIEEIQQLKKQKQADAKATKEAQKATPVEPASETTAAAEPEHVAEADSGVDSAKQAAAPNDPAPIEKNYENETAALDLEDDEMVEFDDGEVPGKKDASQDVDTTDDEFMLDDPKKE